MTIATKLSTALRLLKNRWPVLVHDFTMIPLAWFLAYWIRYFFGDSSLTQLTGLSIPQQREAVSLLPLVFLVQGSAFVSFGLYRGVWLFVSLLDLTRIVKTVVVSTALLAVAIFLFTRLAYVPRSVFVFDALFLIALLATPRVVYRLIKDHHLSRKPLEKVLVVGAGAAGESLVRDLIRMRPRVYLPVAFVDDAHQKLGREIHGIRVAGSSKEIPDIVKQWEVDLIMLALPSASSSDMRRIVENCEASGVPFRTLPKLQSLVSGQVGISELREVQIDDLLGRAPVGLDPKAVGQRLAGKVIFITGGGGSIGSELCRQIAGLGPEKLVVLDQSEFNLYQIEEELKQSRPELSLYCELGDVCDAAGLRYIVDNHRPDVIFHAAAYKHVPMLEGKIREAVRNNIIGTWNIAQLADELGCSDFVMVSTDKAVNPTNIMGATKRVAEIICQTMDNHSDTRFITTRFGNVLGSAGSVVPLFQRQIKRGGPVTVTDKEITRYFMTIPEACRLILQTTVMGRGGEIFVLDMGDPIRIYYLAEQLIRLSGKNPGDDIEIKVIGLRPGEKLHEELFHNEEDLTNTEHKKVMLARSRQTDRETLVSSIEVMQQAVSNCDIDKLTHQLRVLVPEMKYGSHGD